MLKSATFGVKPLVPAKFCMTPDVGYLEMHYNCKEITYNVEFKLPRVRVRQLANQIS
jgi:hypothetical protein